MVDVIFDLKNQLLEDMLRETRERGIDHLDKEKVDMIKDLSESEKNCWKASYYRAITEAMEEGNSGYPMNQGMYGYGQDYNGYYEGMSGASRGANVGNRSGGQSMGGDSGYPMNMGMYGYRNSMGQYARRGYTTSRGMGYHEHINALKMELANANPQERERIMQDLRAMETMQ